MTHAATTTVALFGVKWLDANYLLHSLGPWFLPVVAIIIFAECGLLFGFFLPGDTVLFPLGLFIATGHVQTPLWLACFVLSICAIVGNIVGYGVGYLTGPKLFNKPDSRFFKQEYVDKTHAFFDKYGTAAIFLGRFVPFVRTFITAVAGVGRMDVKRYLTISVIGGIVWVSGVTVLGYFLGQLAFVGKNIDAILVLVVIVSVIPIVIEFARGRRQRKSTTRGNV